MNEGSDEMELCGTGSTNEIVSPDQGEYTESQYIALIEAQKDTGEHLMKVTMENIKLELECKELKSQLDAEKRTENDSRKRKHEKIDKTEESSKDLKQQLEEINAKYKTLQTAHESLNMLKEQDGLQLIESGAKIKELEQELHQTKQLNESLLKEKAMFVKMAEGSKTDCQSLQDENKALRLDNERLLALNKPSTPSPLSPTLVNAEKVGILKKKSINVKEKSRNGSIGSETDKEKISEHEKRRSVDERKILNKPINDDKMQLVEVKKQLVEARKQLNDAICRLENKREKLKQVTKERDEWKSKYDAKCDDFKKEMFLVKVEAFETLNVPYKKEVEDLKEERDLARNERDSAQKERDLARRERDSLANEKLSIISSEQFVPLKKIVSQLKEDNNRLKTDSDLLKEEMERKFKKLVKKINEFDKDGKNIENSYNSLLPIVLDVASKSHHLFGQFKQLIKEKSEATDLVMSTENENDDNFNVVADSSTDIKVVDNDLIEKWKEQIDAMKRDKDYFEEEALSKQVLAQDLEMQLEEEKNKRCKIEFELKEAQGQVKAEKIRANEADEKYQKMVKTLFNAAGLASSASSSS